MHNCKASSSLMCTNEKFQCDDGSGEVEGGRYRSLIGRLIYLTYTHQDISYDVGVISRYVNRPSRFHGGATK